MSYPFIGEIRMVGFYFAPAGWAFCDGALIPIEENEALFTVIGTTYGGDGQSTFALPNLQSRLPIHQGTSSASGTTYQMGEMGGVEAVTLTTQQIPNHWHTYQGRAGSGSLSNPANGVWAASGLNQFAPPAALSPMRPNLVNPAGGSQPHDNMMPFLVINFVISLFGIFPTQN